MYAYALASAADPPDRTWSSLVAASAQISTVEHYPRLGTAAGAALTARVMAAELVARFDRVEIRHMEASLLLPDVITIASQRNLWHRAYEFWSSTKPYGADRSEKGNGWYVAPLSSFSLSA